MELARVMSQYEFDKSILFVAFAGEEQGLVGSSLMAAKRAKKIETSRPYSTTTSSAPTSPATAA